MFLSIATGSSTNRNQKPMVSPAISVKQPTLSRLLKRMRALWYRQSTLLRVLPRPPLLPLPPLLPASLQVAPLLPRRRHHQRQVLRYKSLETLLPRFKQVYSRPEQLCLLLLLCRWRSIEGGRSRRMVWEEGRKWFRVFQLSFLGFGLKDIGVDWSRENHI